ncbi:LpxL/LpxP family Kdo(2)-lipid IV(A) lauroyl/palmitoleoyl acyltransferase [Exilibacterium tricleocarpae]|uniref:Lipid A biosynthesis acyltransferase n=1 Tax=Exilibacterium tricleocarpae TaxID=2591008 RepID=A0A545U810_9GAMM|nr:LpxL/LpxP family Kdo(2)-lipid IV(A) lauroyl/palmitoleoyl acyltransferase [Exilibacterium tricleocarpae]TQV85615.1 LpxL/LpxP family Kdo(2)-lipid IV(A) lauroyl/palmitoleoyl acyltransferase [Exilibacterium tricleocarpae]
MDKPRFNAAMLHPRFWPTWLGIGCWWLISQLPYRWQMGLGRLFGWLSFYFARRRYAIADRNLALCFPELDAAARRQLLRENFYSTGMALFESGIAWFWPQWRLRRLFTIEGLEHLQRAKEAGEGVVLLAMHFTTLDIGAAFMNMSHSIDGMYRPHNNPVYDLVQYRGRARHSTDTAVIPRGDLRAMIRALRDGRAAWYAPDQDYGRRFSIFVPFFGIPAATVSATAKFARLGDARVIPFTQTRLPRGRGYKVTVHAPLENFPSGDDSLDATAINAFIEARIREQPEQYLWVHRRFKTRPPGAPDLYDDAGKKRKKRRPAAERA